MERLMRLFERTLWGSRLFIIVAILMLMLAWLVMLFISTVDVILLFGRVGGYLNLALATAERDALRTYIISTIIGVVDGYLIASALFLLSIGLYKQFVGNIDEIEGSEIANRILDVRSFEDLKVRLARVIVLILMVKFLQEGLRVSYQTPQDMLFLAIGVALISGAIFLSHIAGKGGH